MALTRANANLDFIKTTLYPRGYKTAPAPQLDNPAFPKKVDISLEYTVTAVAQNWNGTGTAATELEGVANNEGLLLWLVQLGVDSIFHMGFVRGNGNTTFIWSGGGQNVRGLHDGMTIGPGGSANGDGSCNPQVFWWHGPVAIPYAEQDMSVAIAPDLSANFSDTKMFAAIVELATGGVPIGNTALTGQFTAGSLSDTRGCSYSRNGTDVSCFSIVDIVQQSVTMKDAVKQVIAQEGIVLLQGPDIPTDFSAPQQMNVDVLHGEFTDFTFANYNAEPMIGDGSQDKQWFYHPHLVGAAWVTPWPTSFAMNQGGNLPAVNVDPLTIQNWNRIQVDPIDETGVLDVDVSASIACDFGLDRFLQDTTSIDLMCEAIHFFCTCNKDGTVNYNTVHDLETIDRYTNATSNAQVQGERTSFNAERLPFGPVSFRPRMYRQSFREVGKYMGTFINIFVQYHGLTQNPAGTWPLATDLANFVTVTVTAPPTLRIRARGINHEGRKGPARVCTWRNIAIGETFIIRGQFQVACVPTGTIAPFVQDAAGMASVAADVNTDTLMSALYNGPSHVFKRVWIKTKYDQMLNTVFNDMNIGTIAGMLEGDNKSLSAGNAAGLFSGLGSTIGGIADDILGGAAGQFGRSAGEFGHSAGEFGSAAGEFGESMGRRRLR